MKRKLKLLVKIFNSLGMASASSFIIAHLLKRKMVHVFIKELDQKIYMRPWTGDFATLRQVIWDKEYDFNLDEVQSVIDLGANIGISTLVLANKFPEAHVIALEPEKNNFQLLQLNTSTKKNIKILNAAVWYQDGKVNIIDDTVKSNEFKVTNSSKSIKNEMIESISISSLMNRFNFLKIDLLKIDIEGAEEDIFVKGDLSWLSKIRCCIIEIHSTGFGADLLELMKKDYSCIPKGEKFLFTRTKSI